ncbi:MAG TPA: class I SAM-dependent methyltransferase [Gemmataceae bacterium]|jgi:predicted O-methyltransferase YrrM
MLETAQRLEKWENGEVLKLPHFFRFNPLEFPICTRTPQRHNVATAWIGHVPFAMCLVDIVKPRVLVELGTHWGVSYCAFCQAVKELRLPTECFAVDTWQGDPHASFYTNEVLDDLERHHDERYALFSKLLRSTFDDALAQFEESSIDVLHIDGYHTYEAVKHDFETWLPKISNRGVILFHDIEVREQESFGVWRFWDEIKQKYPHLAFYHSHGLGVLAVGESIPEGLRPLVGLSQADGDQIRRYFTNLGDHLAELYSVSIQKENLAELLHAKTDECCRLTAEADAAQRTIAALRSELDFLRHRHSQLWFRASNKAIRLLQRMPVVYWPTRATVLGSARVLRKIKRLVSPAVS